MGCQTENTVSSKERSRSEVDETREWHAAWKHLDLLPVAPNMEAGVSPPPGHGRGGANRGLDPKT